MEWACTFAGSGENETKVNGSIDALWSLAVAKDGESGAAAVEPTQDSPAKALEIVERCRGFDFVVPGKIVWLIVRPGERRDIVCRAKAARVIGLSRKPGEARLQLLERFAVTALGLLNLLQEAA
jgi:hypothetical protein